MSPIPLPSVSKEGVLETLQSLGYIVIGYVLAGLLHNYFAGYRRWIAGIILLPLSPSFKWTKPDTSTTPSRNAGKGPGAAEAATITGGVQSGATPEGHEKIAAPHWSSLATRRLLNVASGVEKGNVGVREGTDSKSRRRHKRLQGSLLSTVKV